VQSVSARFAAGAGGSALGLGLGAALLLAAAPECVGGSVRTVALGAAPGPAPPEQPAAPSATATNTTATRP
jgi:hypothetical protein